MTYTDNFSQTVIFHTLSGVSNADHILLLVVQSDYNRIRENDAFLAISKAISGAFPSDFNPYTSVCDIYEP